MKQYRLPKQSAQRSLQSLITAFLAAFLTGILPLSVFSCDNRSEEKDTEKLQWMALYLTRPSDIRTICLESMVAPFECANESGIPGAAEYYVQAYESVYGFSVPAPRGRAELCDRIAESESYPLLELEEGQTVSQGTKACYLRCESEYYLRSQQNDLCNASDYPELNSQEDEDYEQCIDDCMKEGTILPP